MPDTTMPPVQHAQINGVELAYYEAGPRGVGVPVILCHGFPELAFSWRHQLKALGEADVWVIAPDQRGYGGSSKPANVSDYDVHTRPAMVDRRGADAVDPPEIASVGRTSRGTRPSPAIGNESVSVAMSRRPTTATSAAAKVVARGR